MSFTFIVTAAKKLLNTPLRRSSLAPAMNALLKRGRKSVRRLAIVTLLCPPILFAIGSIAERFRGDRYIVPLARGCVLQSTGPGDYGQVPKEAGPFELVCADANDLLFDEPMGHAYDSEEPSPSSSVIRNVERVAVSGGFILGRTPQCWFIWDVRNPAPWICWLAEDYQLDLAINHIADTPLQDPADLARQLPAAAVRPWQYRALHGLWGMSDYAWYAGVQIIGFFLVVIAGIGVASLPVRRARLPWCATPLAGFALLVGLSTNMLSNGSLRGDGPDAFAGSITLTIGAVIAALGSFSVLFVIDGLFSKPESGPSVSSPAAA